MGSNSSFTYQAIKRSAAIPVLLVLVLFILPVFPSRAQTFVLNGTASLVSGNTFRLTPDSPHVAGAIWSLNRIDLTQPFDFSFMAYFGDKDANGGHGLGFVLQKTGQQVLGETGNGMGYKGISPSVGFIFDTYEDILLGDPFFDHVSLHTNGIVTHGPTAPTAQASFVSSNIEDGLWHTIRVVWNPLGFTLQIYFDNILRINTSKDLVGLVFGGTTQVWWGIVAATGAVSNVQEVSFHQAFPPVAATSLKMCAGDTVRIVAPLGSNYNWFSLVPGISNITIRDPLLYPASAASFNLAYTDTTGNVSFLQVQANVNPLPIPYLLYVPGGDSTYCKGGPGVDISLSGSQTTVRYDLLLNGTVYWPGVSGNGSGISFGYQQPSGLYNSRGMDSITGCMNNMLGTVTVIIDSLPLVFNVTGAGFYCLGGPGRLLGLDGSEVGVNYRLFRNGTTLVTTVPGTGAAISFGFQPVAGNYTVRAINPATGCLRWMNGTAVVGIYLLPTVSLLAQAPACTGSPPIALGGGQPLGGAYSGIGILNDTLFGTAVPGLVAVTYTYTDANGCSNSATASLQLFPLPDPDLGSDTFFCSGDSLVLQPSQAFSSYAWSQGSPSSSIVVSTPGNYSLTVSDTQGCMGSDTILVFMESLPAVTFMAPGSYCEDDPVDSLSGGWPGGGVYAGPGVNGAWYDPALTGVGTFILTYTYTDAATGCINTDTAQLVVHPLPQVQHAPLPAVCVSQPPFPLAGGAPAGGTYSGTGVSAGTFYPLFGAGNYTITYTYADPSSGCSADTQVSLLVNSLPLVSIPPFPVVCEGDGPVILLPGSPQGGYYSGLGISGGTFSPVNGPGLYLIRYHYTDPATGCTDSTAAILQVRPRPVVSLSIPGPLCESSTPVTLTGGLPVGGTYSGTFIAGSQFTPLLAGSYPVTYSYQHPVTTCSASMVDTILVNPVPQVSFPALTPVCESAPPFALSGGLPLGGVYTGYGVSTGWFNPNVGPGNYLIRYYYQDSLSGCSDSAFSSQQVYALPIITHPAIPDLCMYDLPYSLPGGVPPGGWYTGSGISGMVFDPGIAGVYALHYHFLDSNTGCQDSILLMVNVYDAPSLSFTVPSPLCQNDPAIPLTGGLPAGGTYGGSGVVAGAFYPVIGAGTHVVWYAYQDLLTSCRDTVYDTILVHPLPNILLSGLGPFCLSDPDTLLLNGTPLGGVYSGNGVSGGVFSPPAAGIGSHQITYTFLDSLTACSASANTGIIVYPLPQVSLSALPSLCLNDPLLQLTGASPAGGTWHGTGVTGNVFNPLVSGSGSFEITYTYANPLTGCADSVSDTLWVHPLPQVSLLIDTFLCNNQGSLSLYGGLPAGGTYSGAGVVGNTFTPTTGAGNYIIMYTVEALLSSCRDTALDTLVVHPLPLVLFAAPPDLCEGSPAVNLTTGLPTGGIYLGTGVIGTSFDPAVGVGSHVITYTYTDPVTSCSSAAVDSIMVFPLPIVSAPLLGSFCENDTLVILPQGTPAGGNWGGPGVTASTFDPGQGVGIHPIWYTWQDSTSGCADTAFQGVTVHEVPLVSFSPPGPFCDGASAVVMGSGTPAGGSYTGPGVVGNQFDPGFGPGNYLITYTYQDPQTACVASDTGSITVNPKPLVSAGPDLLLCEDTLPYLLQGGTPAGGNWTGSFLSGGLFDPPSPGTFMFIYTYIDSLTACLATDTMEILVSALPDPSIPASINLCEGDEYLITAPAGYAAYQWSDGSIAPYLLITQPGTYWLQVTDLSLCKSIPDTLEAIYFPLPDPGLLEEMSGCRNAPVLLEGMPGMSAYLWQDGSSGRDYQAYAPGIYWLEVMDGNGCRARDSVVVVFLPTPVVNLPAMLYLCDRPFIRVDVSQDEPGCHYYWSDGDTHAVRELYAAGEYFVTVTNGECEGWGNIIIYPCAEIWAANAFTPNGDGINDLFRIYTSEPLIAGTLSIFNRWGQVVFTSNDPLAAWDGRYRGVDCPQDVYVWVFEFVREGLVPIEREGRRVGHIVLIR